YKYNKSTLRPYLFFQRIIGRGTPCGKGRDHPSRRAHPKTYANIVTTVLSCKEWQEKRTFLQVKSFENQLFKGEIAGM
ncbi:MAG: hypothetical protein J6B31_00330, partial [Bacteroidaceae bacterium]|nr:hypothetical protein [Bacteroidaceae bacterium]